MKVKLQDVVRELNRRNVRFASDLNAKDLSKMIKSVEQLKTNMLKIYSSNETKFIDDMMDNYEKNKIKLNFSNYSKGLAFLINAVRSLKDFQADCERQKYI